jgi:hypothetical protein
LIVAGRGDEECATVGRVVDGGIEHTAGRVAAETDVDDFRAGIHRRDDGAGHRVEIAGA